MTRALARERGGIVTGWLLKLLISLTIVAIGVFEAGAVVVAKVQVDGIAIDAADAAGANYHDTLSEEEALLAADGIARQREARALEARVTKDLRYVQVTVEKRAKTMFIHNIGFLKDHTRSRATHRGVIR